METPNTQWAEQNSFGEDLEMVKELQQPTECPTKKKPH
jgi:hypothetical protein